MPFAAAAPIAGIASSLLGGIAGASNPRPPSLSPVQQQALNTLLPQLMQQVQGPVSIDPVQQAALFGQIAQSTTGANNQVTHALASRGLGQSGILGAALMQNANTAQTQQNNANLALQQQAIQQRQANIGDITQLLGVNNTPGQSTAGGFFSGLAPVMAYSLQNMANSRNNQNANAGGGTDSSGGEYGSYS